MLISDEHQLILMLPQKCGSETLQSRLKELHSCPEIGSGPFYEPNVKRYLSKHITLRVARKLPAYQQRKHYRKACFVRNPYDRVYSWFCWQCRLSEKPLPFYEKRTIDFVNRRFKPDFKYFGYEMLEPEDFPQRLG